MRIKKIVDLSMDITNSTPVYPGDPEPDIRPAATIEQDGYNVSQVNFGSHTGTHVDAPVHINKNGQTIDEAGLVPFMGRGMIIDVTGKGPGDPITLEDIIPYLKRMDSEVIVLFYTGWSVFVGEERYYKHPYLSIEAVEAMLAKGVRTFLIDALNIDPPDGSSFGAHEAITEVNGIIGENLTNLEAVDFADPFIMALPLKLKGLDGSPVRAVAIEFI